MKNKLTLKTALKKSGQRRFIMNKDEILSKSRKENKIADEYETHIRLRAGKICKAVGVSIAFLLVLIDAIWLDIAAIGWTALTIAFGMNAIEDWIVVIGTKAKTEWFSTVFDTAMLIASTIMLVKVVI